MIKILGSLSCCKAEATDDHRPDRLSRCSFRAIVPSRLVSVRSYWRFVAEQYHVLGEGNGNPLQCSRLENPRDGEPGRLPSMGLPRVGHDWSDLAAAAVPCALTAEDGVNGRQISHHVPKSGDSACWFGSLGVMCRRVLEERVGVILTTPRPAVTARLCMPQFSLVLLPLRVMGCFFVVLEHWKKRQNEVACLIF